MSADPHPDGRARGVSLWLAPDPENARRLARLIDELARGLGGPFFEPHVTLLGGLEGDEAELVRSARDLAASTAPLSVELGALGQRDEFFRCLYVEAFPTADLLTLHDRARAAFQHDDARPFFPHLSLAYGHHPRARRLQLVEDVGGALRLVLDVRRLEVWRTQGAVSEWRRLASHALGASSR